MFREGPPGEKKPMCASLYRGHAGCGSTTSERAWRVGVPAMRAERPPAARRLPGLPRPDASARLGKRVSFESVEPKEATRHDPEVHNRPEEGVRSALERTRVIITAVIRNDRLIRELVYK